MKNNIDIQPLVDVVKTLRAPNGCPWDQKQTHESLRRYFIEETYEVVDAIDNIGIYTAYMLTMAWL